MSVKADIKSLKALTRDQVEFTASILNDWVANDGAGSDDGHDAVMGAVDLARVMLDFEFDSDTEGFRAWITGETEEPPFMFASVDGFSPKLYKLAAKFNKEVGAGLVTLSDVSAERSLIPHAIDHCTDPDCEVHNPEMVEDDDARATAKAYFIAGAAEMAGLMVGVHGENNRYIDRCYAELFDQHSLKDNSYGS